MNKKNKLWESLGSEYVLKNKWIRVRKETVKLPSGLIMDDFYTVEGSEIVAILAIDHDDNVLLVRQYRHAVKDVTVDLPGGGVKDREKPIDAARRELLEETGYMAGELKKILTYYPDSGKTTNIKHIFLATNIKMDDVSNNKMDKTEDIDLVRMPLKLVEKSIKNGDFMEATLYLSVLLYLFDLHDRRK